MIMKEEKKEIELKQKEVLSTDMSKGYLIGWDNLIKEYKLKECYVEPCWEHISKHVELFCKYQNVSEYFVNKYFNYFINNGKLLTELLMYNKFSEIFIRKHLDKVELPIIGITQDLSEDFIEEYGDEIGWDKISKFQKLSELFIIKHKDKLDWVSIINKQELSDEFIEDNISLFKNGIINKNKNIKSKTRVYNFNLPDDLREYLKEKSDENKSTISQEIVNLILDDKNTVRGSIRRDSSSKLEIVNYWIKSGLISEKLFKYQIRNISYALEICQLELLDNGSKKYSDEFCTLIFPFVYRNFINAKEEIDIFSISKKVLDLILFFKDFLENGGNIEKSEEGEFIVAADKAFNDKSKTNYRVTENKTKNGKVFYMAEYMTQYLNRSDWYPVNERNMHYTTKEEAKNAIFLYDDLINSVQNVVFSL